MGTESMIIVVSILHLIIVVAYFVQTVKKPEGKAKRRTEDVIKNAQPYVTGHLMLL